MATRLGLPRRADLHRLRLPLSAHGRRRRALVPQPRRAAGRGGSRGHLPDAPPVARRRATPASRGAAWSPVGPRMQLYARRPAADRAAARVRARRARGTCCATAGATTSCTRRRSRTSRCWRPALAGRSRRYRLVVDWHEVWTRGYWREYLGRARRARSAGACSGSACGSRSARSASRGCTSGGCASEGFARRR